ncbi:hypothetical protein [Alysiella filiformis]|uniref:Uncharacterized protein n=1 Tax=Alysiella filiformis DSM 16848 TaxID=1120981 RepID=A0A286ES23_9NEIS|nr:hypothetical protein [Alysiella filiformis]QMT31973.1 hypothetical protein H3L97_03605 [Alysiella filiformis]UBQ57119.1 hypothetical protein JF568_05070 [Alysiella filiformis DSM 16848]SOD73725.1 hypothetical protein SAMN02746062_02283 [Alysiella filiformis DSM 16848]
MREIQEFDRLTRVSLQNAAQQLKGKHSTFECETVILQHDIWKWVFFGVLFVEIVIVHFVLGVLFILIGEFLWHAYVFLLTFTLILTLLFLFFRIMPILRLSQKGWSPIKIKLDELRQNLRIEFTDQSRKDRIYGFHSGITVYGIFPLPTHATAQDRQLQEYIYQELKQKTGLRFQAALQD